MKRRDTCKYQCHVGAVAGMVDELARVGGRARKRGRPPSGSNCPDRLARTPILQIVSMLKWLYRSWICAPFKFLLPMLYWGYRRGRHPAAASANYLQQLRDRAIRVEPRCPSPPSTPAPTRSCLTQLGTHTMQQEVPVG